MLTNRYIIYWYTHSRDVYRHRFIALRACIFFHPETWIWLNMLCVTLANRFRDVYFCLTIFKTSENIFEWRKKKTECEGMHWKCGHTSNPINDWLECDVLIIFLSFQVVLVFILSIASLIIYFVDASNKYVEMCVRFSENITQQIDLAFNIFFMVYFFIRVSTANAVLCICVSVWKEAKLNWFVVLTLFLSPSRLSVHVHRRCRCRALFSDAVLYLALSCSS